MRFDGLGESGESGEGPDLWHTPASTEVVWTQVTRSMTGISGQSPGPCGLRRRLLYLEQAV